MKLIFWKKFSRVDQKLLKSNALTRVMKKQWDEISQPEDITERDIIWAGILSGIELVDKAQNQVLVSIRKYRIAKLYAAAASVLLLVSISILGYLSLSPEKENLKYIVHSGNQQTETIILADGSHIKLGAGSTLTYPAEFSGKERVVTLDGQAFFNVSENKEKPFVIRMDNVSVTVLGTSFEVFNDKDNYTFETALLSGKVRIDFEDYHLNKKESYFLYPDQLIRLSLEDGESHISRIDANSYSAWRNYNGLRFNSETLSVIIPKLERWFGTRIICKNERILKENFTFKVTDESLEQIIGLMSKTSPISCQKEESGYILF